MQGFHREREKINDRQPENTSNVKVALFNFKSKSYINLSIFQKRIIILIILYTSCALFHIAAESLEHFLSLSIMMFMLHRQKIILYSSHLNCSEMELAFCWLTHFLNVDYFSRHRLKKHTLCHSYIYSAEQTENHVFETNCFY